MRFPLHWLTLALTAPLLGAQPLGDSPLDLPPPAIIDGRHTLQPLPPEAEGETEMERRQEAIHHGRFYAAAVSQLNEMELRLRGARRRGEYRDLIRQFPGPFNSVALHEIFWQVQTESLAPADEERHLLARRTVGTGLYHRARNQWPAGIWIAFSLDLRTGAIRPVASGGLDAPWGWVPLGVIDLFPHAWALTTPQGPVRQLERSTARIQPAQMAHRLAWAEAFLAEEADPPHVEDVMLISETQAASDPWWMERALRHSLAPTPAIEAERVGELIDEVFEGALDEPSLAKWMVWSPDIAVLGWDTHRAEPVLATTTSLQAGGLWGVIPILAYDRRIRPDREDQALHALATMHWDVIRAAVTRYRAIPPGLSP